MALLKDYYNTDDDSAKVMSTATAWKAQVFEASSAYAIGSVKLLFQRDGSPGTITVSIREAEEWITGWWRPKGADLESGSISGTSFADLTKGWVEIPLDNAYSLTSGTKYAIVLRIDDTGGGYMQWYNDGSSPTYAGGNYAESANSGTSWTPSTSIDFMFETYDNFSPPTDITTARRLVAAANDKIHYET